MAYLPLDLAFKGRWVVITGIRDLAPEGVAILRETMEEIVHGGPAGIVFGGARGVDTGALRFAHAARGDWGTATPRLLVVVPGTVREQPRACATAIRECADEVIELGRSLSDVASFKHRNGVMLLEATKRTPKGDSFVVAFPGRDTPYGGTRHTMARARAVGCPVYEIEVPATPGGKD